MKLIEGTGPEAVTTEKILLKSMVKWESANTPGRTFYGTLQARLGNWGVVDGRIIRLTRLRAVVSGRSTFAGGAA